MHSGIRIHEIKMAQQMPSKPMFMRTWSTNYQAFSDNRHMQDALIETTHQGTNLSAAALAPIANSILIPDARSGRIAGLGASEKRFSIQIIVEITDSQMLSNYEVITAYTDFFGFSDASGRPLIDDNMLLFVNGVADMGRESYGNGANHWTIGNITQVLSPVTGSMGGETTLDTNMVSCRPTDTISVMASKVMSGAGSRTTVSSMLLTAGNKRSTRENNVAANFLSKTIGSYRDEMIDPTGSEEDAILNAAANPSISDPATTASTFLRELRYKTAYQAERAISWSDLRKLDPSLKTDDMRIKVIPLARGAEDTMLAMANGAENWDSAYNETQIGQLAMSAIPAFMSSRLIGEIDIEAHNATTTGEVVVNIHSMRGIRPDVDLVAQRKTIEESFRRSVFAQLNSGQIGRTLYIKASMGLVGMAQMMIEINGNGKRPFNAALYDDAAWSPCLADGLQKLSDLAQELDIICSTTTNKALGAMHDMDSVISGTHNPRGVVPQISRSPNGGSGGLLNLSGGSQPVAVDGLIPLNQTIGKPGGLGF